MSKFSGRLARAAVPALALATAVIAPGLAGASPTGHGAEPIVQTVHLRQLNGSGAHGNGALVLRGNEAQIAFRVRGVLAAAPHAQHIHVGGEGRCPTRRADTNNDGIVNTTEGHPAYGHIGTSLTTAGDTSPASGLAIDRFPTPDRENYTYKRTITVTDDVAASIRDGNAVLVVHGIDPNGSGTYDGSAPSDLDPSLPLEATSPAACGAFHKHNGLDINLDLLIHLGLDG